MTTTITPNTISPSSPSDKIVHNDDEYYDEETYSNSTPTKTTNKNQQHTTPIRKLSTFSISSSTTHHHPFLHASQIKSRRRNSSDDDDENNAMLVSDDNLLFDVDDITDVDTLRHTILDLHKKLVRAKRSLVEKDALIQSLRITIQKQQQEYDQLIVSSDEDIDNDETGMMTTNDLSSTPPLTTNQSISNHHLHPPPFNSTTTTTTTTAVALSLPIPPPTLESSGSVQKGFKKIIVRKSSKPLSYESLSSDHHTSTTTTTTTTITINDNQEVKKPLVFRKSSLPESALSDVSSTQQHDSTMMINSPRLELNGIPRGSRERIESSSNTSSVSSPSDITQLTEDDIKILSNRRKRNNQLYIDSPNLESKGGIDLSINLLSDYDEITNNQLFGLQDLGSYFFRGVYPDVDPNYEYFEAASQLAILGTDLESVSSSLIMTSSDLTKKARLSNKNRNNTILKSSEKIESNQSTAPLSAPQQLHPYENYFVCIAEKSLEPLFRPENLEKYCGFNEEESPENIVRDSTTNVVRSATLDKLIVLLTSNEEFENEYMYLFLLTYRSFTTPMDLLEKLILRFNTPPPQECLTLEKENKISEMEVLFQNFQSKVLTPMRLRVGQVLSSWIQNHFYDFREDVELKFKLDSLIDEMYEIGMKTLSKTLRTLLQKSSKRKETFKIQQLEEVKHRQELQDNIKKNSKGNSILSLKNFKMLNRNSEENLKNMPLVYLGNNRLCLQLTLISYRLFEKLRPKEFLNQNWMKETRSKKAPNIYAMINRSNEIGMWVATDILSYEDVKERAYVLKQFIKIASECEKIRNYNTMYDIVAGLNSNPIHRLKKTWDIVPEKWKSRFQELLELTSPKRSYHAMREALANNADKTVLPYIGMFLTDLLFIEEGNTDFTKDGNLINFSKRRLLGQLIRQIQTYQQGFYQIEIIPLVHQRLNHLVYRPMDELYEISCKLEIPPQVTKKKKKAIVYDDDSTTTSDSTEISSNQSATVGVEQEDSNVLSNSNLSPTNNDPNHLTTIKKRTSSEVSVDSHTSEEMSESFDEPRHERHITDI